MKFGLVLIGFICLIHGMTDAIEMDEFKQKLNEIGSSNAVIGYIIDRLGDKFEQLKELDEEKRESEKEQTLRKRAKWTARIDKIMRDINVLEQLIKDEQHTDELLKLLPGSVTEDMNNDVETIRQRVNGMNKFMDTSFDDVDHLLNDVRQSAVSRNVQVAGVVLYGGIGSACSYQTDCILAHSTCRHGACQCNLGLSFDTLRNTCVDSCDIYGSTYQFTKNKYIDGYNNLSMDNKTVNECQAECERDDLGFVCRSIDYFASTKQCFMSADTKQEVPDSSWKYNGIGVHLQRDCSGKE